MTEFTDIEKEFEILEQTDEWEESFKVGRHTFMN